MTADRPKVSLDSLLAVATALAPAIKAASDIKARLEQLGLPTTMTEDKDDPPVAESMQVAVMADIKQLKPDLLAKRNAYVQAAFVLARHIDAYSTEAQTAAELSAIARAISELRTVMDRLTGVASDDDGDEGKRLSTPHWAASEVPPAVRDETES